MIRNYVSETLIVFFDSTIQKVKRVVTSLIPFLLLIILLGSLPVLANAEDFGSDPPKIGVKHIIHFAGLNVTDSHQGGNNFSVQQNFFIQLSNGSLLVVQGGYDVFYTGSPGSPNQVVYVRQWCMVWLVDPTTLKVTDVTGVKRFGGVGYVSAGKPCTFNLEVDCYINKTNPTKLMVSGNQSTVSGKDSEGWDWKNAAVTGSIVTAKTIPALSGTSWANKNTRPHISLAGYGGSSTAIWGNKTKGWVEAYDATAYTANKPQWVQDNNAEIVKAADTVTAEESENMRWTFDPNTKRGEFQYTEKTPPSDEEGIASFYLAVPIPVGGFSVPIDVISVDKPGLLAPYIGLASTIMVATVATAVYVKRVKRRKEKQ